MRELGYVEGQNILVEGRFYGDHTDRLPALAAELVRLNVDVIVAGATPAPEAAQRATSTIPIVMAIHVDPVRSGLVASLAKPEKNVTGVSERGTGSGTIIEGTSPSPGSAGSQRGRGDGQGLEYEWTCSWAFIALRSQKASR